MKQLKKKDDSKDQQSEKKKITKTENGDKLQDESSAAVLFLKKITSDKAKLVMVIFLSLIFAIASWQYMHPAVIIGLLIGVAIGYVVIARVKRREYITIIEKPPDQSARLMYADPDFFAQLNHKDEPATLDEPDLKVTERTVEEDGEEKVEKKVAMKGIQNTRKGSKLIICQDFAPEKGYVYFGWVDGMSEIDFIVEKGILNRLTLTNKFLKQKITEELSTAHSLALQEEERFIEEWTSLPEEKTKPKERIEKYKEKAKTLGLGGEDNG